MDRRRDGPVKGGGCLGREGEGGGSCLGRPEGKDCCLNFNYLLKI